MDEMTVRELVASAVAEAMAANTPAPPRAEHENAATVRVMRDAAAELRDSTQPGSPQWALADSVFRAAERELLRIAT